MSALAPEQGGHGGPPHCRTDNGIAAIVLAAGLSRRWGADNKLLAPIGGTTMLRRSVEAVIESGIAPVIVVTGHEAEQVRTALDGLDVAFAHAAGFAEGMSASLRAGIGAVPAACAGVLTCLGDMPFVRPETIRLIAAAYDPAGPWVALVPVHKGRRGNPVLLGRPLFQEIAHLAGDQGARGLLSAIPERVLEVAVDDPGVLRDVDRPEALGE